MRRRVIIRLMDQGRLGSSRRDFSPTTVVGCNDVPDVIDAFLIKPDTDSRLGLVQRAHRFARRDRRLVGHDVAVGQTVADARVNLGKIVKETANQNDVQSEIGEPLPPIGVRIQTEQRHVDRMRENRHPPIGDLPLRLNAW